MEKKAKIEYFYRIISSLTKYKVEEIENSIISYFLNELGCKNREDIFTLLRNKASKASKEIEDVLMLNQFPVNIETLIEFFEFLIAQEDKTETASFSHQNILQTTSRMIYLTTLVIGIVKLK